MAFMGIFFMFVIIGVLGFLLLMTVVFLIIGIVMKKKKKSGSTILFVLSGICIAIPVALILFLVLPRRIELKTPNGVEKVWNTEIDDIREIVIKSNKTGEIDTKIVEKMVRKSPELIYYTDYYYAQYVDQPTLLEWAVFYEEYELAEFLIEYGAEFDNDITYEKLIYDTSLESYFYDISSSENSKISYNVTDFMLKNGADFKNILLDSFVYEYIFKDRQVTADDVEVIRYLIENGADIYAKNGNWSPIDSLKQVRQDYEGNFETNDNFQNIVRMLKGEIK